MSRLNVLHTFSKFSYTLLFTDSYRRASLFLDHRLLSCRYLTNCSISTNDFVNNLQKREEKMSNKAQLQTLAQLNNLEKISKTKVESGISSPISYEDVKKVVSRAMGSEAEIIDYHVTPFSKFITGILAIHYILKVELKQKNSFEVVPLTFFIKSAYRYDQTGKKFYASDEHSFQEEVHFFKKIYPNITKKFEGELAIPKCFLVKKYIFIFEDLGSAGYSMSKEAFFNLERLKSVSTALAKFHASSILLEKRLRLPLNKVYPNFFREKHFLPGSKLWQIVSVTAESTYRLAKHFGLESFNINQVLNHLQDTVKPNQSEQNVICHGDIWRNNIIWKNNQCILVDYQLLRYAHPVKDIVQLMYVNCDPVYRESYEDDILEHYYSVLSETLKQNNCEEKVLSFEEVVKTYEGNKLLGSYYALMYLPGLLLEPEEFVKVQTDITKLEKFLFEYRTDILLSQIEKSPKYANILKGLIENFLKEYKISLV